MLKFIALIGFLSLISIPAFADTTYSTVMEDLPLMQGMHELPEDTTVFDNPGGRIMEFSVETAESATVVKDFYTRTLPPLGWKASDATHFVREKEQLKLDFDKKGDETIVHFAVTPVKGQ